MGINKNNQVIAVNVGSNTANLSSALKKALQHPGPALVEESAEMCGAMYQEITLPA